MADSAETDSLYTPSSSYEQPSQVEFAPAYPETSFDGNHYPGIIIDPGAAEPEAPSQAGRLIAREIIETFLLTLLIFWVVNTMTGRFRIEGSSMMPTTARRRVCFN